jgi:DNA repair protein RadA/Sms
MAKSTRRTAPRYACADCGAESLRWAGRCLKCGQFGTVAEVAPITVVRGGAAEKPKRAARPVTQVAAEETHRTATGIGEFDRVLGGGLVAGQVVLLAGEPGVGKSTLLLEVANAMAHGIAAHRTPDSRQRVCLYVSGEESAEQIGVRARRIGADAATLLVADEQELPAIVGHIEAHQPELVVIDSVQTLSSPQIEGRPGGVAQVLEVTQALTRIAKSRGMPLVLIGQSTRENSVAGPRALEHLVDTVLTFEGDRHTSLRMLRATKNRYGPADEVACFEQAATGLREVPDPSEMFRGRRDAPVSGTCVTVTVEGRRPMLAEIQALTVKATPPNVRRGVNGLDASRVAMLTAVTTHLGELRLTDKDLFVATVGGARVNDPAADLAVCMAVASAAWQAPLPPDVIAVGEVSLSGDVRPCPMLPERIAEAGRLGFRTILVPRHARDRVVKPPDARIVEVPDLDTALEALTRYRPTLVE